MRATCLAIVMGILLGVSGVAGAQSLKWARIGSFDHTPPFSEGSRLNVVGCPSDQFCVAEGPEITSSTMPGSGAWSATPAPAGAQPTKVVCPSTALCVGWNPSTTEIFSSTDPAGGAWSQTAVGFSQPVVGISCPTTTLCTAIDHAGQAVTSPEPSTGSWTAAPGLPAGFQPSSLSCPSDGLCVAAGTEPMGIGATYTTPGVVVATSDPAAGGWEPMTVDSRPLESISCPNPTLCVALDQELAPVVSTTPASGGWAVHPSIDMQIAAFGVQAFSCSTAGSCVLVGRSSNSVLAASASNFDAWRSITLHRASVLQDVACAATLCVAVDDAGHAFASSDPATAKTWSQHLVAGVGQLSGVSCSSAHLCAAVDVGGRAFISTAPASGRGAWRLSMVRAGHALTGVACRAMSLCAAVDGTGDLFILRHPSQPGHWKRTVIDRGRRLEAIACPTVHLCVAVDARGGLLSSADPGGGRRRWHRVTLGFRVHTVSCPNSRFCAVQGFTHVAFSSDPTGPVSAWKVRRPAKGYDLFAISCSGSHHCVSLGEPGCCQLDALSTNDPLGTRNWKRASLADHPHEGNLSAALSCPTASFCAAVDDFGDASGGRKPFGNRNWSLAAVSPFAITDVSCTSRHLCLAVDRLGGLIVGT